MALPDKIRIVSRKLQLDHTFYPDSELNNVDLEEYIKLIKKGVFDEVKILPNKNDVFIYSLDGDKKEYLNQWISLSEISEIIYDYY